MSGLAMTLIFENCDQMCYGFCNTNVGEPYVKVQWNKNYTENKDEFD